MDSMQLLFPYLIFLYTQCLTGVADYWIPGHVAVLQGQLRKKGFLLQVQGKKLPSIGRTFRDAGRCNKQSPLIHSLPWISSFFHGSTEVFWGVHYADIFSLYLSISTVHSPSSCSLPPEANPENLLYLLPHLLSNVQLVWPIGSLGWRVEEWGWGQEIYLPTCEFLQSWLCPFTSFMSLSDSPLHSALPVSRFVNACLSLVLWPGVVTTYAVPCHPFQGTAFSWGFPEQCPTV